MTHKESIETLVALACCIEPLLLCEDCPFYGEPDADEIDMSKCGKQNSEAVVMAVRVLKEWKREEYDYCGNCRFKQNGETWKHYTYYTYPCNDCRHRAADHFAYVGDAQKGGAE